MHRSLGWIVIYDFFSEKGVMVFRLWGISVTKLFQIFALTVALQSNENVRKLGELEHQKF